MAKKINISEYPGVGGPNRDVLYKDLLTKSGGPGGGWGGKLVKGAKRFGPEMIGWYLLDKFLAGRNEKKMQNIQMQGMREGAEASSPENLYYQASLPQAQQEEEMARSALLSQLSGGVIGPSLAKGERMIGG